MVAPSFGRLVLADRLTGMAFGLAGGSVLLAGIGAVMVAVEGKTGFVGVALGGVVFAALGTLLLRARMGAVRAALAGRVARATVIEVLANGSKARVRYRFDADGAVVEGAQTAWFERVPAVGDPIEVAFDPQNPRSSVAVAPFR